MPNLYIGDDGKKNENHSELNSSNKDKDLEVQTSKKLTEDQSFQDPFLVSSQYSERSMSKHSVEAIVNSPQKRKNTEPDFFENEFNEYEKYSKEKKRKYSANETDVLISEKSR
jgi:hypothetical protein